jgi:hypothetical protein
MDRFIAKASASSSSAAQPEANVSSSSAAQPARQLSTISAVLRWLSTLTEQTASARLKDIRAAAEVLETPKPMKMDVRPLCKTWSVQRTTWSVQRTMKQKDRPLPEIIRDLREKVIDAFQFCNFVNFVNCANFVNFK